jgi:hypothetical protein
MLARNRQRPALSRLCTRPEQQKRYGGLTGPQHNRA